MDNCHTFRPFPITSYGRTILVFDDDIKVQTRERRVYFGNHHFKNENCLSRVKTNYEERGGGNVKAKGSCYLRRRSYTRTLRVKPRDRSVTKLRKRSTKKKFLGNFFFRLSLLTPSKKKKTIAIRTFPRRRNRFNSVPRHLPPRSECKRKNTPGI